MKRKPTYDELLKKVEYYEKKEQHTTANNTTKGITIVPEQKLENIIFNGNNPILVWNRNYEIQRYNTSFEILTGYNAVELIGKKIDFIFPSINLSSAKDTIESSLSNFLWKTLEISLTCKNGKTHTILWELATVSNKKKIISTIAQAHEIKDKLFNKIHLKKEQDKLNNYLNAFDDGVYLCSEDKDIQYLNSAMIAKIGRNAIGEKCYKAIYGLDKPCSYCYYDELKEKGKTSVELELNNNIFLVKSILLENNSKISIYTDITKLKQIELDLKKQNLELYNSQKEHKKLSVAVQQSTSTIIITDTDGNIEYTNPKFTETSGYTAEEVLGKNPRFLKSGKQSKEFYTNLWNTILRGEIWTGKLNNKTKEGESYWEQGTITPIKNKEGEITNFLADKEDITALKESENRLNSFINAVTDIICYKDGDGKWLLANDADLDLFCLTNVDYYGKTDADLAPYTNEIYKKSFLSCMVSDEDAWKNKKPSKGIEIIPTIHGTEKVYDIVKIPTFYDDGKRKGLAVIGRDITQQKEEEEILRQSEYMVSSSSDMMALLDLNLNYMLANSTYSEAFNETSENIIGKNISQLAESNVFNKVIKPYIHQCISTSKKINYQEWFDLPAYGKRYMDVTYTPYLDKHNNVVGLIINGRNITEQKNIETDLILAKNKAEESDRLKTEFINNMSHEIRTPLNGILGFSEIIADTPSISSKKLKNYAAIIKNSGIQLTHIIDDILEISRLGTKQVKPIKQEVNLNNVLLHLFSIFDLKAKENEVPLYLKNGLLDAHSYIYTDALKLNKILSNLLQNAIKFTKKGFIEIGYVLNSTSKKPQIEIYVKDTGIGINKENFNLIFERFSQEEKEISQKTGGLGLGLSIAKENAELLGGAINLESEKGKGTTFTLIIPYNPVTSKNRSIRKQIPSNSQGNSRTTILIAEDEEVNYIFLETLLHDSLNIDCDLLHAKNGNEAIEFCRKHKTIDLVLMDIKMPQLNGYEATKIIKEFRPNLPIIAQTAYSTQNDINKSKTMGCDDFISKPISKKTLKNILSTYLKITS